MVIVEHYDCTTVTNVSQEHCFFSTLKLLEFNVFAAEKQYKMPFKPDMFRVPNKKGLEVVLHFLLTRLDPPRSKQEFVACWPAYDVKRSHMFRKNVFNWLTELNRDHVEGVQIPRINSSTLTKASGLLVINMLERLSALVLANSMARNEHKEQAKFTPSFSPSKPHLNLAAAEVLHLELEVLKRKIAQKAEQTHLLRGKWDEAARETADQIQKQSKRKKKLEMKKDGLETRQKDYITAFSADKKFIKTLSVADEDALRTDVQHKASQLKQHLRRLSEMYKRRVAERAVINSLINGSYGEHVIHHDKIALQVPSIIIQQYQKKLAEGSIGNTYCGGDLCLVALTKISYIGLKLLLDAVDNEAESQHVPVPILQQRCSDLSANLALLENLNTWLDELDQDTRLSRADLWLADPQLSLYNQDIRLQSPMPVFSLTTGPASSPSKFMHVSPLTPKPKPKITAALTPLSMRKYHKGVRRTSSLAANPKEEGKENVEENVEEEDEENCDIIQNLSHAFENRKSIELSTLSRREPHLSKELNDLSLLDASTNMSFLN